MNKVCLGCGIVLQSESKERKGYVLPEKLDQATYCERCYRLKHYHELSMDSLNICNAEILDQVNKLKIPVYYFVDLVNLNEESFGYFRRIKAPKILVITKMDLIPKTISFSRMLQRIQDIYHIQEDMIPLSSKSEKMVARIWNHIVRNNYQKVCFIGMTNVGKSTLIRELSRYVLKTDAEVLVSEMPNTTQNFLEWKFEDRFIVDAPGFNYEHGLSFEIYLKSVPKTYFHPITEPMKKETVLVFEDLFSIQQDEEKNSITFYGSNQFLLKRIYQEVSSFQVKDSVFIPSNSDLVIPGIGFFYFKHSTNIVLASEKNISYEVRSSLFGGQNDTN